MAETSFPSKPNRILELDALRAMAALNLMLFHFTHVYSVKYGYASPLGFEWPFGKYGVALFFMLSGYVNAMTLYRKRDIGHFFSARMIRILPLFYFAIGLNLLLHWFQPLTSNEAINIWQLLANLTLMPNLFGEACIEPVMWTLQVELLFYGFVAMFFWSGGLNRPLRPLLMYLLLCLLGETIANHLPHISSLNWSGQMVMFLNQILILKYLPLFAIGIFTFGIRSRTSPSLDNWLGLLSAVIVFHAIDDHQHNPFATALLWGLLLASAYGRLPILRFKPLVFLSSISYPLFLIHNNVGSVLIYYLNDAKIPPMACLAAAVILSVWLAWTVTRFLERPLTSWLLRLKTSLVPKPTGRVAVELCKSTYPSAYSSAIDKTNS